MKNVMKLFIETISLQTARGRLIFASVIHLILIFVPYNWLNNLSLYKLLGFTSAPSIGLTRAYWLVLHSDIYGAWQRNWLIFPVLAVGWSIVALDIYRMLKNFKSKQASARGISY